MAEEAKIEGETRRLPFHFSYFIEMLKVTIALQLIFIGQLND